MIELLAQLLTIWLSGGDLCSAGKPIDYYDYAARNPDAEMVLYLRTDELELMILEPGQVLFVYTSGLGDDGMPHGECAVGLP